MSPRERQEFLDVSHLPMPEVMDRMAETVGTWTDDWIELSEDQRNKIPVCYFREKFDRMQEFIAIVRTKKLAAQDDFMPPPPTMPALPAPAPPLLLQAPVIQLPPKPVFLSPTLEWTSVEVGKGRTQRTIEILQRHNAAT